MTGALGVRSLAPDARNPRSPCAFAGAPGRPAAKDLRHVYRTRSLASAIIVLVTLETAALILLFGAQLIAELERRADQMPTPREPFSAGLAPKAEEGCSP